MHRLLAGLLMIAILSVSNAQDTLRYGDEIVDTLKSVDQILHYSLVGDDNDIIWLRMRDLEKVDAHFRIYDPSGAIIAEDFDIGGHTEVTGLLLQDSGVYHIEAFDHGHNDIGRIGISINKLNSPGYGTKLPCYINFMDSISTTCGVNVYHFQSEEGDLVYTQMRAQTSHLEPLYHIYSNEGILLGSSERQGRLARNTLRIPYSGSFYVFVIDHGGNDADAYGFSLQTLNRVDCYPDLVCGQTGFDNISTLAGRNPYVLDMKSGESGILQMRSTNPSLEIAFEVYDENGTLLIKDTGSDKMIGTQLLARSDQKYLIIVEDKHGNDIGSYGLHYETLYGEVCASEILCDKQNEFEHRLDGVAQIKSYRIHGTENEAWSFLVKEHELALEPYLRIYGPDGKMIEEKYGSTFVRSNGVFPITGSYMVLVGDKSGNDTGAYSFTSSGSEIVLEMPDTVVGQSSDCILLAPKSNVGIRSYTWSTGEETESIQYCENYSSMVFLDVVFENGCSATDSTMIIMNEQPCAIIDFNEFASGEVITDQLSIVNISAKSDKNGTDVLCIFPSGDPPLYDTDLGTPGEDFGGPGKGKGGKKDAKAPNSMAQDKVLIIAENTIDLNRDGLLDRPDDEQNGGTITFDFTREVEIKSLKAIDMENEGSKIELWGLTNKKLGTFPLGPLGDNSVQKIDINISGVYRMEIKMKGSGAIDDIEYCPGPDISILSRYSADEPGVDADQLFVQSDPSINRDSGTGISNFEKVTVFPNPARDVLNILIPPREDISYTVSVYNMMGVLLDETVKMRSRTSELLSLNVADKIPGVYFVEINSESAREVHRFQIL